jgi:hypothetical protein
VRRSRPYFLWKIERHFKGWALAAFVSAHDKPIRSAARHPGEKNRRSVEPLAPIERQIRQVWAARAQIAQH